MVKDVFERNKRKANRSPLGRWWSDPEYRKELDKAYEEQAKKELSIEVDRYNDTFYFFLPEPVGKLLWIHFNLKFEKGKQRYILHATPNKEHYVAVFNEYAPAKMLGRQLINYHDSIIGGDKEVEYWKIIEAFCVNNPDNAIDWFSAEESDD